MCVRDLAKRLLCIAVVLVIMLSCTVDWFTPITNVVVRMQAA